MGAAIAKLLLKCMYRDGVASKKVPCQILVETPVLVTTYPNFVEISSRFLFHLWVRK